MLVTIFCFESCLPFLSEGISIYCVLVSLVGAVLSLSLSLLCTGVVGWCSTVPVSQFTVYWCHWLVQYGPCLLVYCVLVSLVGAVLSLSLSLLCTGVISWCSIVPVS